MNQSRALHLCKPITEGACVLPLRYPVKNYAARTDNYSPCLNHYAWVFSLSKIWSSCKTSTGSLLSNSFYELDYWELEFEKFTDYL